MRMINKKAQQMTLGTIIAIVLGIAVLVFLIFGFSTGWNSLWDQVTVGTSSSNVELKIADCESDCSAGEESAWCYETKDLRFFSKGEDKIVKVEGSCFEFNRGNLSEDDKKYNASVKTLGIRNCVPFTCT